MESLLISNSSHDYSLLDIHHGTDDEGNLERWSVRRLTGQAMWKSMANEDSNHAM